MTDYEINAFASATALDEAESKEKLRLERIKNEETATEAVPA